MRPSRPVALLVALFGLPLVLAAFAAEGRFGTTRYRLAGTAYAVPHAYAFSRNVPLSWLDALPGLGREPADSLWLMLPAAEIAAGLASPTRPRPVASPRTPRTSARPTIATTSSTATG